MAALKGRDDAYTSLSSTQRDHKERTNVFYALFLRHEKEDEKNIKNF